MGECPARKSLSLPFLLIYTFAASGADPKLKWIWNSFWVEATRPKSERAQDAYIREWVRDRHSTASTARR